MKGINKPYIIILITLLFFSCQSERIFQSGEIIKSIEKNKDWSDYYELGYKKEIDRFNSSLDDIFKFRNEKISLLIKQQNLKDFATEELFFYNPIVDRMGYTVYIIEKKFAYGFSTEVLQDSMKRITLKEFNKGYKFFIFRNDSIIINKGASYNKNKKFPSYVSTYSNKKLDMILAIDSVIYKRKNSKTEVNFQHKNK